MQRDAFSRMVIVFKSAALDAGLGIAASLLYVKLTGLGRNQFSTACRRMG